MRRKDVLVVQVEVTNTGEYDMDEVVQLYVSPADTAGGLPFTSLKGFQRVALKKGEKRNLSFTIQPEDLMVTDEDGEKVWRKGEYRVIVGNASPGARSLELGAALAQEAMITLK